MAAPRICVAGVGAVGGALAGALGAAGEEVRLFARGRRRAQLMRDGLVVHIEGAHPIRIRAPVSERADFGEQDIVFLAVKSHALPGLIPQLLPLIGPTTLVVPLVNGIPWWYFAGHGGHDGGATVPSVDPGGILWRSIPAQRIIGCVAYLTSRMEDSGVVSLRGAQRLHIGEIAGAALPRTRALGALLCRAGIETSVSTSIRDELWTKVGLNLATNPLSVVAGATLLALFTNPALLPVTTAVLAEAQRVAQAHGARPTLSLEEMVATGRRAGEFETSMLQDYNAGRPLELDAIGHAVLDLAERVREPMPTARAIVNLAGYLGEKRVPQGAA
jgi:2-dehydropantoate 2-reductase